MDKIQPNLKTRYDKLKRLLPQLSRNMINVLFVLESDICSCLRMKCELYMLVIFSYKKHRTTCNMYNISTLVSTNSCESGCVAV
uniref:Uncharacterized protein n=1 Tax=Arion vulgaris TaxID=1028688 RepID=A0A0B6YPI9_9EUPU